MSANKKLEKAILKSLAYSGLFKYPLSFNQLGTYLGTKTTYSQLAKTLRKLEKKKKISQKQGKYYLYRKQTVSWQKRYQTAQTKEKLARKVLRDLEKIPWIKMIALTGPLAAHNPGKKGDIDIFVIAKKNRLWLTRAFIVLYLKASKNYRTDKDPNNKVCPNLLISEENLEWKKDKRNLFIASEIVRMQPILNKSNTYERFLEANRWIQNFFPNFKFTKVESKPKFNPSLLNLLEKWAFRLQKGYMQKKITSEKVRPNKIHFNKNDISSDVMRRFKKEVKRLL